MVERHQDYQLTIPTVPAGGLTDVPLQLDTDAPFLLRLVKSRNLGLSGFRFQNPSKAWQSSELRTDLIQVLGQGVFPSRGRPVYPQMVYPIGSQIVCDIGNNTGESLTNVKLLFRGSKLFQDGAISAPTYPPRLSPLTYTYQTLVSQLGVSGASGTRLDNQLKVKSDADFVLRCGVCNPWGFAVDGQATSRNVAFFQQFRELYVTLRDESRKAYSNEPIHVNDLFGQAVPLSTGSGGNDDQVAYTAGLFTPEIYVPRDHSLYFDCFRSDDPSDSLVNMPVDLWFEFYGCKVFLA